MLCDSRKKTRFSRLGLCTRCVLVWTGQQTGTCMDLAFLLLSQTEPPASLALGRWVCVMGREHPPAATVVLPIKKRVCKLLETFPNEADARLIDCAMELDSKQKLSSGCGPWDTKTKPNSMIFENQGSRGTAQPCPRCIAGESGHFNHILGF
nr:uncharacterized protein C10orf143 homolog isoform X1 [Anser cygnoides]